MLELTGVTKHYKAYNAVEDISFSVDAGEVFGLVGPNGAGKTTTLSMIATLLKPDKGVILYNKEDIVRKPSAIKKHLGYIPQDIALYESLTGFDNLLFWGKACGAAKKAVLPAIDEICDMLSIDSELLKRPVETYSGGMKRRFNIAAALLHRPDIILMDEPTAGIDTETREVVSKVVRKLAGEGAMVLMVGHYQEEMQQVCDRICYMQQGRITEITRTER